MVLFLVLLSGGSGYLHAASSNNAGFADLVEKSLPGVVRVMTAKAMPGGSAETSSIGIGGTTSQNAASKPPGRRTAGGEGSGVVFSSDGLILTNYHVVENSVRTRIQLHDGRELDARIVAADAPIDLALLKVDASNLQPLPLGDSARIRIGDVVLAIGNPFGVGTTVTQGIVSAMSPSKLGIAGDEDYIQTDAAVNPGNSGGPLLNTSGELIGINTSILSTSGGSNGIGFALPVNVVKSVAAELLANGKVNRGYLGIALQPLTSDLADALGDSSLAGAVITDVISGSPAEKAGLKKGDVITGMNGRVIRDFNRLRLFIAEAKPGVAIQLVIYREGLEKNFWIVLDTRKDDDQTALNSGSPSVRVDDVLPGAAITGTPDGMGAMIVAVDPNGVSAALGLRPGDLIVAANRSAVATIDDLERQMSRSASQGSAALLEVNRQGVTYFLGFRGNNK
jgi:serine protease Do